mmetsp:Transcript_50951/g.119056  ORF Transcript_50951/g.119056 Transcript_50951/m.119056 type:complete len:146 (+) Transcript_50951:83-520(+)
MPRERDQGRVRGSRCHREENSEPLLRPAERRRRPQLDASPRSDAQVQKARRRVELEPVPKRRKKVTNAIFKSREEVPEDVDDHSPQKGRTRHRKHHEEDLRKDRNVKKPPRQTSMSAEAMRREDRRGRRTRRHAEDVDNRSCRDG